MVLKCNEWGQHIYRNGRICNLIRIITSTHFVTAFLSQKSTFFDFLLVTCPYTNLTLQKIKRSNRGFYLGRYGIVVNLIFTKSVCAEKKENLKTFFSIPCNIYCGKNVTLLLLNVRNVRRTLRPNFEHLRTSQFSPKPNFEPPEHPKKPNSSRTPDSSFQD